MCSAPSNPESLDLRYLVDARCFKTLRVKKEIGDEDPPALIEKGLFIEAAVKAQESIISLGSSTTDYKSVFDLWNIRLKALLLAGHEKHACDEARFLGDLDSEKYRLDSMTSVVPWDLRSLVVLLQLRGDGSATLAKLYAMAKECRVEAHMAQDKTKTHAEIDSDVDNTGQITTWQVWESRLRDLAFYVSFILVRLGDIEAAIEHLKNVQHTAQKGSEEDKKFGTRIVPMISLLYLQMGDTESARNILTTHSSIFKAEFLESLCAAIDGDWLQAEILLQKCFDEGENDSIDVVSMTKNNLAVSMFYQGKLDNAFGLFKEIVNSHDSSLNTTSLPSISLKNLLKLQDLLQRPGPALTH